jgi:hypothetical protein
MNEERRTRIVIDDEGWTLVESWLVERVKGRKKEMMTMQLAHDDGARVWKSTEFPSSSREDQLGHAIAWAMDEGMAPVIDVWARA